jgi:hypothetical protein
MRNVLSPFNLDYFYFLKKVIHNKKEKLCGGYTLYLPPFSPGSQPSLPRLELKV